MSLLNLFLVGMGGFTGAICRSLVFLGTSHIFDAPFIPYGTMIVNVVGCFLIGFLGGLSEMRHFFSPEIRALVLIGFLGGFTTYSAFGYEVVSLFRNDQILAAFANTMLHLILGFGAVYCGFSISKLV